MDIHESIELSHQPFLSDHFRKLGLHISDYTFANVYLFRDVSHYEILKKDCGVFISARNVQGQPYIMPLDDPRVCCLDMLRELIDDESFFFPVPEQWLSCFPETDFSFSHDPCESDYIYLTANMASFSGKTYTRHRNHLNQFLGSYRVSALALSEANVTDALEVLNQWQAETILEQAKTDFDLCAQALQYFSELALWGTLYYIDEKPAGFIIGEALTADMFCLHFAKASRQYHGIFEHMFNDTAKRLQGQYRYLNLEEDMGNDNLRHAKMSYGPAFILKKYRVSRRRS